MSENIQLREVTEDNMFRVVMLAVKPEQQGLVATNSNSLAEAYVTRDRAWPRAICLGDEPVGFVMLDLASPVDGDETGGATQCWLWRFMIDAQHQGRGYAFAALRQVIAFVQAQPGIDALYTSYKPQPGNARDLYLKLGFEETGEVDGGEMVMCLALDSESQGATSDG